VRRAPNRTPAGAGAPLAIAAAAGLVLAIHGGSVPARGQAEVYLEVRKSEILRTPVMVEDFVLAVENALGAAGTGLLAGDVRVEDLLAYDLFYSDAFAVVRSAAGDTTGGLRLDLQGRPVGLALRARVQGRVGGSDAAPRLQAALIDEGSHGQVFERSYAVTRVGVGMACDPWEIHRLADEITLYLTGVPGCAATRIAFVRAADGMKELGLIDWDGRNEEALTTLGSIVLSPAWDPGARRIGFTSFHRGSPQLFVLHLNDGRMESLWSGRTPSAVAYTPDGARIAFSASDAGNAEIYQARADGSDARRLTFDPGIDTSPSWSPSGERLVFTSDRTGRPQLFIMDTDGANLTQITYEGDWNDSPEWSPRGDRIVHVAMIEKRFELALVRPDGSGGQRLTTGGGCENPSWAPDGRHVVFARSVGGRRNLWILDVDSGSLRQLTASPRQTYNPAWSPTTRERIRATGRAD